MLLIINFIRGFCMALADSVPGVSGGTIAFLLGFYDEFIESIDKLIFGNLKDKKRSIIFPIKIGIGWIVGMILAVIILTRTFETHIYKVSSLFIGFIIFSIPIIIKEEKNSIIGKYKNILWLIIGTIIVCLITYFNPVAQSGVNVDISSLNIKLGIYVFVCGMIAISAMILPGISGSTLLLIFGLYIPIISAIKEVLHFNLGYLPVLIIFGFGVLSGIACIIRLLHAELKKHRSKMIYLIIGLMIGSIYSIIMGPTTLEITKPQMNFETFNIVFFIIGGIIMLGLQKLKYLSEKNSL